jgi:hypothetical protein
MTQIKRATALALFALLCGLLLAGAAGAGVASPRAAQIDWQVIGGGAGPPMHGEQHQLFSTLGQTAIGMSGNGVQLGSGFWYGMEVRHSVYLPLLLREPA